MKKVTIILLFLLIIAFGIFYFSTDYLKPMEILDDLQTSKLTNEAYLDILVNIEEYNGDESKNYKLLEAGMRIARELNLVQSINEPMYKEYVPREIIHTIIRELTGKQVNNPIVEEDFYYLYDSENDYYYIVPVGTDWIHIGKVKTVNKKGNEYTLYCTCVASDYNDGNIPIYDDVKIVLNKNNDYKYIKYALKSIETSKRLEIKNKGYFTTEYGLNENGEPLYYYAFEPYSYENSLLIAFETNRQGNLYDIANKLVNYYEDNSEAYRNTRLIIIPDYSDEMVERFKNELLLNVDIVIEIKDGDGTIIGDASIAEIFEEEFDIKNEKDFDDEYREKIAFFARQNGDEAAIIELLDGDVQLEKLIKVLDKII